MKRPDAWPTIPVRLLALACGLMLPGEARSEPASPPDHAIVAGGSLDGEILLGELNCVACHRAPQHAGSLAAKKSPVLSHVAQRVTPQYLRLLLANPQQAKPGTPMPDMLHGLPADVQQETREDLLHYLGSLGQPLDQAASGATSFQMDQGRQLFHSVGCIACHEPVDPPPVSKDSGLDPEEEEDVAPDDPATLRPSVPLGQLARKTTVDALAQFLLDPLHVRPSGRMPNLKLQPREARAIAAFLLREQTRGDQQGWASGLDVEVYLGDFKKCGDIADRKPDWTGTVDQVNLDQVQQQFRKLTNNFAVRFHGAIEVPSSGKYQFWTKSDDGSVVLINGKTVVDNDGIHAPAEKQGEIELKAGRHAFEVVLIQGGGGYELTLDWQPPKSKKRKSLPSDIFLHGTAAMIPLDVAELKVDPQRVERGKAAFARLGCAACHETGEQRADSEPAPALAALDVAGQGGCLSTDVAAGRPQFALSPAQRKALGQAIQRIQAGPEELPVDARIARSMTALGCVACHVRSGEGGPDARRARYFTTTTEVDLGDEGRLPPALNEIGAKFSPAGMRGVLLEGWTLRPHMATRMPQFGEHALKDLPEWFASADAAKIPSHKPEFSSKLIDDGRMLVGKGALGCVNCHAWGGKRLQGADGLDLVDMPQRISPGWFHALLADPQRLKPRTRMPTAWPNGKSFFPKIQGGDADRQIDAIWAYLSLGSKGGTPAGLSSDDGLLLVPENEPIVFRTFMRGVGAHAIAVGFRQRAHLAFDALGVRSAKVWAGDFLSAKPAWEGRAGQYAVPEGPAFDLPQAPAFAQLDSPSQTWPAFDPKQKTPPPGYTFRGYRFDAARRPTFLYDFEKIAIEETPATDYRQAGSVMTRTFQLTASEDVPKLWYRAAVGSQIQENDNGSFQVGESTTITIRTTPESKPVVRKLGNTAELLVPVVLQKTNGQHQATMEVQLQW